MATPVLTEQEINDYSRDGYVVPSYRLPMALVSELHVTLQQLIDANPGVRPEKLVSAHIEGKNDDGVIGSQRFLALRSGSVDLNKLTPIDKCHGVGLKGCRVVHGGGRRLATNDRRGGQLGAHRRFHFMQPLVKAASSIAKPALAFCHPDLNDHVHCCTS